MRHVFPHPTSPIAVILTGIALIFNSQRTKNPYKRRNEVIQSMNYHQKVLHSSGWLWIVVIALIVAVLLLGAFGYRSAFHQHIRWTNNENPENCFLFLKNFVNFC